MTPNIRAEVVQAHDAGRENTRELAQTVLLICVKYGSDAETTRFLDSLRKLHGQRNLQVLVVDNTVSVESPEPPTERNFTFIRAEENLGYLGGARAGMSRYLREHPLPDWVIVSNVDLVIADPQFLNKLAALSTRPRLGIVAPSILSALTGKDQNPFMRTRPSAARMHLYKWMFRSWLVLNAYELAGALFHKCRSSLRRVSPNIPGSLPASHESIYAPHGSFLIFSRNYFDLGGDLQFPEFLFGEEIYVAETMKRIELEVVYAPFLQVTHHEHQSTKLFRSRKIAAYVASSAAYSADVFFPLPSKH